MATYQPWVLGVGGRGGPGLLAVDKPGLLEPVLAITYLQWPWLLVVKVWNGPLSAFATKALVEATEFDPAIISILKITEL